MPTVAVGKRLIEEMTRLVNCWTYKSEQEQIALKVLMILTALLLQKTTLNSKERKKEKEKEKKRKGKKKENSETYPILWIFSVGVQAELWTDARPGLIMPFF